MNIQRTEAFSTTLRNTLTTKTSEAIKNVSAAQAASLSAVDSFEGPNEVAPRSAVATLATKKKKKKVAQNATTKKTNVPPKPAGSAAEQFRQADSTVAMSKNAGLSIASGGKLPSNDFLKAQLRSLGTTPPLKGAYTSRIDYTSNLQSSPAKAYAYFVNNFEAAFKAGGLKLRPAPKKLTDGARMFMQQAGAPPLFLPVVVKLDPKKREVRITTLDGHPLRGTNVFSFTAGNNGTTKLVQKTTFQGSSPLTVFGAKFAGALERQHAVWKDIHAHLYKKL